jgi:hypothetical protein
MKTIQNGAFGRDKLQGFRYRTPPKEKRMNSHDLDQLDRFRQVIDLKISETQTHIQDGVSESVVSLTPKSFEAFSSRLILWQHRLQEISRLVKQAEQSLTQEDVLGKNLLTGLKKLQEKIAAIPDISEDFYTNA